MKKYLTLGLILPCLTLDLAHAQPSEQKKTGTSDEWSLSAGVGALFSPNYLGDDSYSLSLVPAIRATYGDRFFASVQEGAGYNIIKQENFRAGPLVRVEFGRDEDGSSLFRISGDRTEDLLGLGDIDTSVSLGGFAELDVGELTFSTNLGKAVSGHNGLTGEIGLSYKRVIRGNGPPIILSLGPNARFADRTFMTSFFGVNDIQAINTGLDIFDPEGGLYSYGFSSTTIIPLTQSVSVTLIGSYNRLTSDAANAPLVTKRGSQDQAFFGIVTSYRIQ